MSADWGEQLHGLMAKLSLQVGGLQDSSDKLNSARYRLLQNIGPFAPQSLDGTVTGGGALTIGRAETLGPRTGKVWDVHRISLSGTLTGSSLYVPIYKTPTPAVAGATYQNFLCQILIGGTQIQTFGKGQCIVRAGESIMAYQSAGLTATQVGVITVEGIEIAAEYVGEYFI